MADNTFIFIWLTSYLEREPTKDERLKHSLLTAYKLRQDSLPACGGTPSLNGGPHSIAVWDRLIFERLNDVFAIKSRLNPPHIGYARQFGQRMSSIESTGGKSSTNNLIGRQRWLWCWQETTKVSQQVDSFFSSTHGLELDPLWAAESYPDVSPCLQWLSRDWGSLSEK